MAKRYCLPLYIANQLTVCGASRADRNRMRVAGPLSVTTACPVGKVERNKISGTQPAKTHWISKDRVPAPCAPGVAKMPEEADTCAKARAAHLALGASFSELTLGNTHTMLTTCMRQ